MLELDLILQPFLEKIYPQLEETHRQYFQKLLECEDQDLFSWLLRREDPADPDLLAIVGIIRDSRHQLR